MDHTSFDDLTVRFANRRSRRAVLRLLAGGLLGGVLAARGGSALAQRADSDGDGLFDDDETDVYGTDPFNPDTDGDGSDDGQEVYDGTDPLVNGNAAPAPAPAPAGPVCQVSEIVCNGSCVQPLYDNFNCGFCGVVCGAGQYCIEGFCSGIAPNPAPAPAPAPCSGLYCLPPIHQ